MRTVSLNLRRIATVGVSCSLLCFIGGCNSTRIFSEVHEDQFSNTFSPTELDILENSVMTTVKYDGQVEVVIPDITDNNSRNRYVAMKMFEMDREYFKYVTLLTAADTGVVSFADFAQLGLTTAATAIPVVQTTKVLAAVATAVGGAKGVYNSDLLRTQTIQAIHTQMDADRTKIKTVIGTRLLKCDIDEYPKGFVLSDMQALGTAGTADSAIASMLNSATKSKQAATSASSTASTDSASGGVSPKDPNSKSVDVAGGTLTYSFKAGSPCPLPKTTANPPPKVAAK